MMLILPQMRKKSWWVGGTRFNIKRKPSTRNNILKEFTLAIVLKSGTFNTLGLQDKIK